MKYYHTEYFQVISIAQIFILICAFPVISFILRSAVNISGLNGLTEKNFLHLFSNPISTLLFILSIIIVILLTYIESVLYIFILDKHHNSKTFSLKKFWKLLFSKKQEVVAFQFIILIIYFIIIMPLSKLNITSSLISFIHIPDALSFKFLSTPLGSIVYVFTLLLTTYLNIRLIFLLFVFIDKPEISLASSAKKSFQISKGQIFRLFILVFLFGSILIASIPLFQFVVLIPVFISDLISPNISPFIAGISISMMSLYLFTLAGVSKILLTHLIKYFFLKYETPEKLVYISKLQHSSIKMRLPFRIITSVSIMIFIFSNIIMVANVVYSSQTMIISHRGYTANAIDNTIESLEASVPFSPNYVEIDIQETKDGELVVFHDDNLSKLAGVNNSIYNMSIDEVENISLNYNDSISHIPTLEEYILRAKELDQKLLIELKIHGYESEHLLQNLINILEKHNVTDAYLVQSLDKEIIENLETLNSKVETGFIIAFNFIDLVSSETDFVVIEYFYLNDNLIAQAHNRGQDVFVWTVNDEDQIIKYMSKNVEAVITDELYLANDIKENLIVNNSITNKLKILISNLINRYELRSI